jgi:signal transduction histidine kinase/pSer/pThr/pTyr-binding forkhead associated (FHA) protein
MRRVSEDLRAIGRIVWELGAGVGVGRAGLARASYGWAVLSLLVIQGPDQGRRFPLPKDVPQLIGRSSEALPMTDNTVSRRHAELTPDGAMWYVRDLSSQNGTWVNGVQIRERIRLEPGDQIRVGATMLLFGPGLTGDGSPVLITGEGEQETDVEARLRSGDSSAGPEAAAEHLRVIYQLTALTARLTNRRELLEAVMELVFNEFRPERGVIMVPGETADADLVVGVVQYRDPPKNEEDARIHVSRTILNVAMNGDGVLSSNAMGDPRFAMGDSVQRYQIRSAICSPIIFGEQRFGAIYIDSSSVNYAFTEEQLALLNAIGQHTGLALANADEHLMRMNSERLAAIGETVASLSHSIKNILQGLRGGADVVEIGLDKGDLAIARNGWGILRRNLDRIVGLTMNMLAFGRKLQLNLELTRINTIAEECVQLCEVSSQEKNIAVIVDADPEMPPIAVDPGLIHQALMNLLMNAIEAAEKDTGAVTIRVTFHEAKPLMDPKRPSATTPPHVEIRVIDNGPGIPQDKLAWIFEPFNTTKGIRGTGLGLAVTKRIIYEHHGRIRVESRPNQGSVFRVLLPADLDAQIDPSATANDKPQMRSMFPGV